MRASAQEAEATGAWSQVGATARLQITRVCNDHCSFCPLEGSDGDPMSLVRIAGELADAQTQGMRGVFLHGGEPTLHPDLPTIARQALRLGLALGVRTNARLFSYPRFAEKMARLGLRYAEVGLYGGRDTHNAITEDASYDQVVAGIDALLDAGVEVTLRCPVVARNLNELGDVRDFANQREGLGLAFVFPETTGGAVAGQGVLAPISDASHALRKLATESEDASFEIWGFPRCMLGSASHLGLTERHATATAASAVPIKPPECSGCGEYEACPGVSSYILQTDPTLCIAPRPKAFVRHHASLRGVPILSTESSFRPPEISRIDTSPRYPDTALVTLIVGGCDLNCIFCETPQGDRPPSPSSLAGVKAGLLAMRERATGVYFTGGEPSSVPWFFDALSFAKSLGFSRIQIQSHAGRASESGYADRLIEAGLSAIDVPFYGHNAAVHETITNTPGSFDRTLAGLENLKARGAKTCVHVTLFESNLGHLADILRFWEKVAPDAAYIQTAGEVGPPGTYERVAPSPSSVGRVLEEALKAAAPSYPLWVTDVAPCHLPGAQSRILRWQGDSDPGAKCMVLPYSDWLMTFTAGQARTHGAPCSECRLKNTCDGISVEALANFGEHELRPM